MCAIPLSFRFSLDFACFPSILVLSRKDELGKENTYEKINHHHLRTYYDALHSAEPERRSTARKRNVRAHRATSRARPEKDPQIRHRMYLSDQRSPLGRQLLSAPAKRQAKEVQRLRRNPRAVRNQTCRNNHPKESRDQGRESKTKRGRRLRRPQNLCQKWQRPSKPIENCIEI